MIFDFSWNSDLWNAELERSFSHFQNDYYIYSFIDLFTLFGTVIWQTLIANAFVMLTHRFSLFSYSLQYAQCVLFTTKFATLFFLWICDISIEKVTLLNFYEQLEFHTQYALVLTFCFAYSIGTLNSDRSGFRNPLFVVNLLGNYE